MKNKSLLRTLAFFAVTGISCAADVKTSALPDGLDDCNVSWDSPGKGFRDSMPIGNGDIGLNVWTEQNGDIVFLIGKTDAWTENGQLVKLGRVRVKLNPNPFAKATRFHQDLKLREAEIVLGEESSATTVRIWVDANHPIAHIEVKSASFTDLQANVELWRLKPRVTMQGSAELQGTGVFRELNNIPSKQIVIDPDTILPARGNRLTWCHRNARSTYPVVFQNQHLESLLSKYPDPLLNRTFGVSMQGPGLVTVDNQTIKSGRSASTHRLDLVMLTGQTEAIGSWQAALDKLVTATENVPLETARQAHKEWWNAFWNRSWINVSGSPEAARVTQGYVMQRWMDACGGRGAMPIKYNGSIFTVGEEVPPASYNPAKGQHDPDYRNWGGNSWFQNTRLLYWPMIAAGDFDLLAPFLKMYRDALPLAKDRTRLYYKHDGGCFPETIYFWGLPNNNDFGWNNPDVIIKNTWIRHYVSGGIELTAMMLDRFDYTQDADFARQTLVPIADAVTTYYDQHWKRDANGKIHMDPAQSLETRQQAINPTPDIAGLMDVLPRLIALPAELASMTQRSMWKKMIADLPPIPLGRTGPGGKIPLFGQSAPDGKPIILPAEKYSGPGNVENVEMYAVFPYRIYGVGRPELELARNTYAAKLFKSSTCWGHDGLDCAMLGMADAAKAEAIANFSAYGGEKYKWFWKQGHDWEPDMDNGGAGMSILQLMLVQCDGKRIQLQPAWPADWDVNFKLLAPYQTTLEGEIRGGRVVNLKVTPESRRKDVVIAGLSPH